MIDGQCRPVITGHGGFCFDFRLTAIFQAADIDIETLASQGGLIHEILMHVNLNISYETLKSDVYNLAVRSTSVIDGGKLNVEMQMTVRIKDLVSIANVYSGVVAGLAQHSLRANWSGVPYTAILTPTPYKPLSTDEREMPMFHDSTSVQLYCPVVYAMAEIQACEGVKLLEFHQMTGNVIQVSDNAVLINSLLMWIFL